MRVFERQDEESAKAYRAFAIYRDLGPERSLRKACEICYGSTSNLRQLSRWSARFEWVARAQAYDDHNELIRREAIEMHELSRAVDLAARVEALREKNLENEELAAALEAECLERAEKLLDELPLVQKTVVREEDGKPVTCILQPATKNAVLDAARLHKIATRSEPAKIDLLRNLDLSQLTDEQLERIAAGEDPARVLGESS